MREDVYLHFVDEKKKGGEVRSELDVGLNSLNMYYHDVRNVDDTLHSYQDNRFFNIFRSVFNKSIAHVKQ